MDAIHCYAENAEEEQSKYSLPPIVVVGTCSDKVNVRIVKVWFVRMLHKYEHCIQQTTQETQYVCNIIKTFDCSTLYITIPYAILKSRIKELIQRWLSKKNGEQRYQYLVIGKDKSYLSKAIWNLIMNINKTKSFKCKIVC